MRYTGNHNPMTAINRTLRGRRDGFTLVEVVTALVILAFMSSSVLIVINRSVMSAADSALRIEAFRVARENMELLLIDNNLSETVEYGTSEVNPNITWTTLRSASFCTR